jgi:hypothetical protein
MIEKKKKKKRKKDGYSKLTLFKVLIHFFKSDERSRVISEVLKKKKENFTVGYRTITRFDGKVSNDHFSRAGVLNYQKSSHKDCPSGFGVKS